MANRLAGESSPYLLQHQDNPVDWYPWGPEALERAREEDKPIFLSIGYAACHWCHVMAHESFEDPQTAALMNDMFINIKVDREERPDLDGIYMDAVVRMTGQGGWPMSVFLTPEGEPFFGGTYFPPVPRYQMPSFQDILRSVDRAWRQDRQRVTQAGATMAAQIRSGDALWAAGQALDPNTLHQAMMLLAQNYDWQHGGWGKAPKFPQPMTLEFLLRQAISSDKFALEITEHALLSMARGGMYDVVGGGFARYSVDNHWLVPHFEKMLYDNAQLAQVYLHAYLVTRNPFYRWVAEGTIDFVLRELTHSEGGFFSSLDADSEGVEGKFYVWTLEEIRTAIEDPELADLVIAAYGVSQGGNFEGHNVLQRVVDDDALAQAHDLSPNQVVQVLDRAHAQLLEYRSQRVRPGTDDKVLAAWNGLMLVAVAEAARYLDRQDYLEVAIRNAEFLLQALQPEGRLLRAWREGQARHNGYLEDYASLILGLLALYQSDPDPRWFQSAEQLAGEMIAHFSDPAGGFFDTRSDHETLLVRPKETQDNATPSGNALAVSALLQLAAYTGKGEYRDLAESSLGAMQQAVTRYPTAFGNWLGAMAWALAPTREIAVVGEPDDPGTQALLEVVWSHYRPFSVVAVGRPDSPEATPPLLAGRPLLDGLSSAYVCHNFVCTLPVTNPEDLRQQLNQ